MNSIPASVMEVPKSDVRRVLENLIRNDFMSDFDYNTHRFSFRTLFYSTLLDYRFCPCGYNNEYINYVSPKGDVDREMFEKILDCIMNEQCPHVAGVAEDQVEVSSVYAMHFVAAFGTKEAISRFRAANKDYNRMVGLFRVDPCGIAIMKKQGNILGDLLNIYPLKTAECQYIPFAQRLSDDALNIRIDNIHLLELCIRQNDPLLLKQFLQCWPVPDCLTKALEFTFEHGLSFMENILLDHIKTLVQKGRFYYIRPCGEAAVMFKRPDVLHQVLRWSPADVSNDELMRLLRLCTQLGRHACNDILKGFLKIDTNPIVYEGVSNQFHIYLEDNYDSYDSIREDMVPVMKKITKSPLALSTLDYAISNILAPKGRSKFSPTRTRTLKALLECGGDINSLLLRSSPLTILLGIPVQKCKLFYKEFRHNLEIILSSNLDFEERGNTNLRQTHKSVLELSLRIDEFLNGKRLASHFIYRPGDYMLDMRMHTHSGHTEQVFHFVLPLLIECGYRFDKDELLKATQLPLYNEELQYIERYINEPRPLMKQCRDVLRRTFKGPKIHAYMERIDIPLKIKNFILLKDILLVGSISMK